MPKEHDDIEAHGDIADGRIGAGGMVCATYKDE